MGKKIKKDKNAGLNPVQIKKRRLLIESVICWLFVFWLLTVATLIAIQAGPFGLDLAPRSGDPVSEVDVVLFSSQIMGGFCLLWFFLAIPAGVFYYRFMCKRRLPKHAPGSSKKIAEAKPVAILTPA